MPVTLGSAPSVSRVDPDLSVLFSVKLRCSGWAATVTPGPRGSFPPAGRCRVLAPPSPTQTGVQWRLWEWGAQGLSPRRQHGHVSSLSAGARCGHCELLSASGGGRPASGCPPRAQAGGGAGQVLGRPLGGEGRLSGGPHVPGSCASCVVGRLASHCNLTVLFF